MMEKELSLTFRSLCPMATGLDVLGDKWSLLIVRDLLIHGPRTYSELLASPEHIATDILSSRLTLLTCLKLIERTNPEATARNNAYQLTEKGAALRPVLEGLAHWAQTHLKDQHHSMASIS